MALMTCSRCGRELSSMEPNCPQCGTSIKKASPKEGTALPEAVPLTDMEAWEKELKRLKLLWILLGMAFWFTFALILFFHYVLERNVHLPIVIMLGTLILGSILKFKTWSHGKRKPAE